MSQTGSFERSASGIKNVVTITGNDQTVTPNSQGDVKIIGSGNVNVDANPTLHTLTITAANSKDASPTQKGLIETSTDAESVTGTSTTVAVTPASMKAKLGDQTDHAVPIAKGQTKKFNYESLNDGQLLIGATGKDPKGANLASSNSTILFTTGQNSLDLKTGSRVPTSVGVDGGQSVIPSGNQFKIQGGSNVSTSANADTVTIDVINPASQDATTTTKGQTRLSTDIESEEGTATGAIAVTPTSLKAKLGSQTLHGIAYGKGTGEQIEWTEGLEDGDLIIGDSDGTPKKASLKSSDSTLSILKTSNSIDLKVSSLFAKRFATNSGNALPVNGQLSITGGKGLETEALGENVIVRVDGTVADKFTTDAGDAVPNDSILEIRGGTNCNTSATGRVITINNTGGGGGGSGSQVTVDTDGTIAKTVNYVLKLKGANNLLQTSGSGNQVTFTVGSHVLAGISTDQGTAVIKRNSLEIHGSDRITTSIDSTNRDRLLISASKQLISSIGTNGRSVFGTDHGITITGGTDCMTKQGSTDKDLVIDVTGGNSSLTFSDTKTPEGISRPFSNKIEMQGDTGIDVTCSGKRNRFAVKGNVPTSIKTDDGTVIPANNAFDVVGGTHCTTKKNANNKLEIDVKAASLGVRRIVTDDGSVTPRSDGGIEFTGGAHLDIVSDPSDSHKILVKETSRTSVITSTSLVILPAESKTYLSNTPASEGATVQLPNLCKVGLQISVIGINSTYPGFEIFPGASQKIWIGDRSSTTAPSDGALSVARVKSVKRGDAISLVCTVENREWQAVSMVGTFQLQ